MVKLIIVDLPMVSAHWLNEDDFDEKNEPGPMTPKKIASWWRKSHLDGLKMLCDNPEE